MLTSQLNLTLGPKVCCSNSQCLQNAGYCRLKRKSSESPSGEQESRGARDENKQWQKNAPLPGGCLFRRQRKACGATAPPSATKPTQPRRLNYRKTIDNIACAIDLRRLVALSHFSFFSGDDVVVPGLSLDGRRVQCLPFAVQ